MGWSAPGSLEERIAEVAIGLVALLGAAAVLLWTAGELAGFVAHGTWPQVAIGDAPAVAAGLVRHPADPTAGWPPAALRAAPPAWLYYGLLALLIAALMSAALAIAARAIGASSERRATGRVPTALRVRPGLRRSERPFIGWTGAGPLSRLLMASSEDCVAVIGPPRVGKTQGVLIPQIMLWDGAVVSTSTKTDVIEATTANRRTLGEAMAWAPTAADLPQSVDSVGWSPLSGCADADTCERRVRALVAASGAGLGARHADHWRDNAVRLLRGYFYAAALDGLGVRGVLHWLARNELREPSVVLSGAGPSWVAGHAAHR